MKKSIESALEAKRTLLEVVAMARYVESRLRQIAESLPEAPDDVVEMRAPPSEGVMLRGVAEMVLEELVPLNEALRAAAEFPHEELEAAWQDRLAGLDASESEPEPPERPERTPEEKARRRRKLQQAARLLERLGQHIGTAWPEQQPRSKGKKGKEKKR